MALAYEQPDPRAVGPVFRGFPSSSPCTTSPLPDLGWVAELFLSRSKVTDEFGAVTFR